MAVKVQFLIGHSSKLRSKKTVEGFTHDWELYVKGINQTDISAFVEKIVFNLHESFQKPKRVCSKPPYVIQESGYAGFLVFIDIYFRNRDEPKKVQFNYDLDLQTTGPPQHRYETKTFIFDNPSEEFRQKLLKNGGVPVSGVVGGTQPAINNNIVAMPTAVTLNHAVGEGHKIITSEGKKHKLRPDDTRSNSFANLFGPPITKTSAVLPNVPPKHSPDNKTSLATGHTGQQGNAGTGLPVVKEKSSKDKEKTSEKSKERSEKREKHHKQTLTSPHKEGRSESKKTDGNKHEKREKTDEKSKKDKNRDKDRERDRDKSSGANVNTNSSSNKRPPSPKAVREQSPHKPVVPGTALANINVNNTNSLPRPASSSSGKIEDAKLSSKSSSKESTGENKSKDIKQKESTSSSSSGKKSKKDKKDRDKDRDKEKRHEEREKQKMAESQQRSNAKEESSKINNNLNAHGNNAATQDSKATKGPITPLNANAANDVNKKPEKVPKQDLFKPNSDKNTASTTTLVPPALVPATNTSSHSSTEKKSSSGSSLNSNQMEKEKRSHKHKKREKNKEKDRERDKEREKDKEKEGNRDKEKGKEKEKEKEVKKEKDKHPEEKIPDTNTNSIKQVLEPLNNNSTEEHASTTSQSTTSSTANSSAIPLTTTPTIPSSSAMPSSSKSSKNKEKKSKEKSSSKEEKLKHKINDPDTNESKAKQAKITSTSSINTSSSLTTSSSSSSVTTSISNAITSQNPSPNQPNAITAITNSSTAEASLHLDLNDADSLPAGTRQQVPSLPNDTMKKPLLKQTSPIITHSDSSNSSFPDMLAKPPAPAPQPKQPVARERSKSIAAPITAPPAPVTFTNPTSKEPPKPIKSATKEKSADKPAKEEEKEKKRRRNSQAVNTFIEPPIKQPKTKEATKSVREKSKSPSLHNTGSRASLTVEGAATFLQPSASPSSTAAAAPLPPPSSAPSAAHSPALSATEAVGNATSATANAATCNNINTAASSTTNSTNMAAAHHLPLEYLSELQELHHKIMSLQDNEDLQHVVELIAATGCYEITTKTFDFDLCKLDRGTVQRLQDFFATSVS